MSDFIEFSTPMGPFFYNANIVNIETISCEGAVWLIKLSNGEMNYLNNNPQEIIAKIEEWKKGKEPQTIEVEIREEIGYFKCNRCGLAKSTCGRHKCLCDPR